MEKLFLKYLRILYLTLLIGMFISSAVVQICIVLFLPAIIIVYVQKYRSKLLTQIDLLLLLLFLSGVISVLLSANRQLSFHSLPRLALLLTAIPLSFLYLKDESINLKFFLFLIAGGGLISGIAGVINHFSTGERAFGLFAGYYTLAAGVIILFFFFKKITLNLFYFQWHRSELFQ
ncbi:MAG: hypothetical protein IPH11_01165 [Ignavibacteriales bacterium]|nr:hypothetical protein [Ignavibacteriales bacterium]